MCGTRRAKKKNPQAAQMEAMADAHEAKISELTAAAKAEQEQTELTHPTTATLRALTAAHEKEMAEQAARHEKELATTIDAMLGAPTLLQIAQSGVPLWCFDCGVAEQRLRRWRRRRLLPRRL